MNNSYGYDNPLVATVGCIRDHPNYWAHQGKGWRVLWDRFAHWKRSDPWPLPPLEEICILASQVLRESD